MTDNIAGEIGRLCRHGQAQRINDAALQMPELMTGAAMMLRRGTTICLVLRATVAISCRGGVMVIAMRLMRRRGSVLVRGHAFRRFPTEARREDGGQQDQQHNAGDFPEQRLHDFYNSRGFCYSKPGRIKGSNSGFKQSHRIAASNRNQRLPPVPLFTRRQADWILGDGSLNAEHLPPAIGRHILQLGT